MLALETSQVTLCHVHTKFILICLVLGYSSNLSVFLVEEPLIMFIPSRIGVLSSKCRLSFLAPREIPGSIARCPRGVVGCALPAELDPTLAKKVALSLPTILI